MKTSVLYFYKILFLLLFSAAVIYAPLLHYSKKIIDKKNNELHKLFNENKIESYIPYKYYLTSEIYIPHYEIHQFSEEKNIILFGASTTQEGIIPELIQMPPNWNLTNCADGIAGKTVYNYDLFYELIKKTSNHKLNKKDIIVLNLHCRTLTDNLSFLNELKTNIEIMGYLTVKDGKIFGNVNYFKRFWKTNNFAIRLAASFLIDYNTYFSPNYQSFSYIFYFLKNKLKNRRPPEKNIFEHTKFSKKDIEDFRHYYLLHMDKTVIPGNTTKKFIELIKKINSHSNVIVLNLYDPDWYDELPIKKNYISWIENELKPYLKKENIYYADFMKAIPEYEYIDRNHLTKPGRVRFTNLFNEMINDYLRNNL